MNIDRRRALLSLFALPFVVAPSQPTPADDRLRHNEELQMSIERRRAADSLAASLADVNRQRDAYLNHLRRVGYPPIKIAGKTVTFE